MSTSDAEAMRTKIVAAIGRDDVYITASDDARHFEPTSFVALYAGQLIFGFLRSAGEWLWDSIKKKAAERGEKAVGDAFDAALKKVKHAVSSEAAVAASSSPQAQAQQLDVASNALKDLGTTIESPYIESFLSAGEAAVSERLMQDNFPEAKARRVAAAVALQVELHLHRTEATS